MTQGVLLFCFNTPDVAYHRITQRCVAQINQHLDLPITVVTNQSTMDQWHNPPAVDYVVIHNETGNRRGSQDWHNLDRCEAYRLSPYDITLLMDTDYFCYTNNLLEYMDSMEDFLIHRDIHDLTGKGLYDFRMNSLIPMLWATVIVFRKTDRAKHMFDMVRYIKQHYQYFCSLYRIDFPNFRNDYAFSIAVNQMAGFNQQYFLPARLPTLPSAARVTGFHNHGVEFEIDGKIGRTEHQDVHVLDKEIVHV